MVPARLCWLPEMPLTPNGKLDLRRLPAIVWQQSKGEPQNELEQTVLAIWQGVLKQPLGVEDDFFRWAVTPSSASSSPPGCGMRGCTAA
jgi:hypothetical protein